MNKWEQKLKSLQESFAVSRILSAYTWSNIVKFPDGERFQANMNTFIKCVAMPEKPIGNVLIIQGGICHMNSNSYYIRTACSLLYKSLRIFIFEKLLPMMNFEFSHDVADCLTFIKREFSGPTCVIGYSMGGILLLSYLSMGYDQADLYIPVCCPLDLDRFHNVISSHYLFRFIQNKAYKCYQVDGYEDLLEISGTSTEKIKHFEKNFINNLNDKIDIWIPKTIYILSSDDPLTRLDDIKLLRKEPLTYYIKGGWHCCLDSIFLSVTLVNRFMKARDDGLKIKPEELSTRLGILDIIKST
jgi:hypothetical protein